MPGCFPQKPCHSLGLQNVDFFLQTNFYKFYLPLCGVTSNPARVPFTNDFGCLFGAITTRTNGIHGGPRLIPEAAK